MRSEPLYVFADSKWWDSSDGSSDDELQGEGLQTLVEGVLEICGCGTPHAVVELMAWYLRTIKAAVGPDGGELPLDDDGFILLAYMADGLGFTEHGGSVLGAWIEPAGQRWLDLATTYLESLK